MTRDYDDRDLDQALDRTPEGEAPDSEREAEAEMEQGEHGERRGGRRGERRERLDSFEKMKVWQEAHQLALRVFAATPKLPAEQQAGLALQMEQAAVSVPKSIAEGFKRRGPRNKAHFYNIAQSSLEGLRYYFILCRDLGYEIDFDDLAYRGDQIARMLDGLIRSMLR